MLQDKLSSSWIRARDALLDFILPPRCPMTGALVGAQGTIDPTYWAQLQFIAKPFCHCCGTPFDFGHSDDTIVCGACLRDPPVFDRARAALKYDDASSRLILKFKHADGTLLTPLFTTWLAQAGAELLDSCDIIMPVPLHRWRLLKRRYNQAALLGAALAKQTGKIHAPLVLRRARHTVPQGHKSRAGRIDNVQGAFTVENPVTIQGKHILLIDDVMTSGATVNECTRVLKRHGAAAVSVLVLARVAHTD